jgi:hypothetical protein
MSHLTAVPGQKQEKEPTPLQIALLRRIEDFFAQNGFRPALYELATSRENLETLKRNGWATWETDRTGRTLRLTEAGKAALQKHGEGKP